MLEPRGFTTAVWTDTGVAAAELLNVDRWAVEAMPSRGDLHGVTLLPHWQFDSAGSLPRITQLPGG